jgi:hypothetical protein
VRFGAKFVAGSVQGQRGRGKEAKLLAAKRAELTFAVMLSLFAMAGNFQSVVFHDDQ